MPKPIIVVSAVVGIAVVVGGAVVLMNKSDKPASNSQNTGSTSQTSETKLDDPNGDYAFFSDPSVTKHPENDTTFGNGQTLSFEYDGSKTNNDEYATLSYQLYYVQEDGKVQPMGGGNLEGRGKGTFTVSDKVYTSNAANRPGFFELQGTSTTSLDANGAITGKNVKLGMYPVKFQISE